MTPIGALVRSLLVCAFVLACGCNGQSPALGPDAALEGGPPSGAGGQGSSEDLCVNLLWDPPMALRCCPDSTPPDCSEKPEGYPGFACTPPCRKSPDAGWSCGQLGDVVGSFCTCSCRGGDWVCGC